MEISDILSQLKGKFGDSLDFGKITQVLSGMDHSKMSITDIISHLSDKGLLGDLDGDGVQESLFEEIKGKAAEMFGGIFHK